MSVSTASLFTSCSASHFFEAHSRLDTILRELFSVVSSATLLPYVTKQEDKLKVFQIEDSWSMENARISSRPDPVPGPGEVRIKMKASALNYRDLIVPERCPLATINS